MNKNRKSLQYGPPQANSRKSRITSSNSKYNTIKVGNKVIGRIEGEEFVKPLRSSIHFLRKPPAIAFDVQSLHQAKAMGANSVKIRDLDTELVYRAPIELIFSKGFQFNRGYGEQIALTLEHWRCQKKKSGNGSPSGGPMILQTSSADQMYRKPKLTDGVKQPRLFN